MRIVANESNLESVFVMKTRGGSGECHSTTHSLTLSLDMGQGRGQAATRFWVILYRLLVDTLSEFLPSSPCQAHIHSVVGVPSDDCLLLLSIVLLPAGGRGLLHLVSLLEMLRLTLLLLLTEANTTLLDSTVA